MSSVTCMETWIKKLAEKALWGRKAVVSALSQYFKYYCTDILLCDLHMRLVESDVGLCFYVALARASQAVAGEDRRLSKWSCLGTPASAGWRKQEMGFLVCCLLGSHWDGSMVRREVNRTESVVFTFILRSVRKEGEELESRLQKQCVWEEAKHLIEQA